MAVEKYHRWKDEDGQPFIPVPLHGLDLLHDTFLCKGTAFTESERKIFRLQGLLPPHVSSLEEQLIRTYKSYSKIKSPIEKYEFLRALQDRKEVLFYALVCKHVQEMIPIIYTPTVGEACKQFSHRFQNTRGLYITKNNVNQIAEMIHHFPSRNIKIIVLTDSQGILGIGDQGVGGMGIPIGKLSLYVLGAGIHPASCLPITLDVGTDNEDRLNDDLYLGLKQHRMKQNEYRTFIKEVVENIKDQFPGAVLQWEDFSKEHAFENMAVYREALPSFNDDIQGTGAVTLAGLLSAMKIKNELLKDQHFIVYGAGAGGAGIAYQLKIALTEQGLSDQDAFDRVFMFDSRGLILNNRPDLEEYKVPFAKNLELTNQWKTAEHDKVSLLEFLANHRVTVLIGASTQAGVFDQSVVEAMLNYTDQPVIFPLSNPTSKCEALPQDLYQFSKGGAIVATGSPFDDVNYKGKSYRIGQGNNVFIFPGVGLAAILGKFPEILPEFFTTAAIALADFMTPEELARREVYPNIGQLREISIHVAQKILEKHSSDSPKDLGSNEEISELIRSAMWKPEYLPYKKV
jgi:malate dehydrogenase (oxaloacetate-decarboxylating)/malate dehydrogenase (oxaloacetate-decarboxylating)(NADP+)